MWTMSFEGLPGGELIDKGFAIWTRDSRPKRRFSFRWALDGSGTRTSPTPATMPWFGVSAASRMPSNASARTRKEAPSVHALARRRGAPGAASLFHRRRDRSSSELAGEHGRSRHLHGPGSGRALPLDFYSQALFKLQRAHEKDLADVDPMHRDDSGYSCSPRRGASGLWRRGRSWPSIC